MLQSAISQIATVIVLLIKGKGVVELFLELVPIHSCYILDLTVSRYLCELPVPTPH
jgi:hypothetical protein